MSQPRSDSEKLFRALASSGGIYRDLEQHFERMLVEQTDLLSREAVAALVQPGLVPHAQVRLGRCEMVRDILSYINLFKRSEPS